MRSAIKMSQHNGVTDLTVILSIIYEMQDFCNPK